MSKHWKMSEIKKLLEGLNAHIDDNPPGGDWDIMGLSLTPQGVDDDSVTISPFKDPNSDGDYKIQDDCEIYALEVRTFSSDSRGGCQTTNEKVAVLYGQITARLRAQGWNIINHYDEIF